MSQPDLQPGQPSQPAQPALNRYAPPQAEVGDPLAGPEHGPVLAGRWRRLGGAVVDAAIVMVMLWLASRITPWNPFDAKNTDLLRFNPVNTVLGFVLFLLVQGYPLVTASQTWGKKVVGTRIVRSDGSAATPGRLIGLRYGVPSLFGLVPAIVQIWSLLDALFIFRASRRCLHDSIADTIVIRL